MRRHLWLAVVVFVLIIAATAVALAAHQPSVTAAPARVAAGAGHQACPMHPEVTSVSREKCSELSASCGSCKPTGR